VVFTIAITFVFSLKQVSLLKFTSFLELDFFILFKAISIVTALLVFIHQSQLF